MSGLYIVIRSCRRQMGRALVFKDKGPRFKSRHDQNFYPRASPVGRNSCKPFVQHMFLRCMAISYDTD